jgi:serine/threonine-protein kinase
MTDLIGMTIGGYQIVEKIGMGGMAVVYKAYQPSLDRDVAIKILPSYYAEQDESFITRFKREARAIARLRHPNILMVMDSGDHEGIAYIVMEYVNAGTLKDHLTEPLSLSGIYPIINQIAKALDYAHGEGVVHRDVKPSNILMPKPDWALLTDFGLAKMVGGSMLTQSGITVGTPAYMSPEQGSGKKIDARTDVYALGVMLYEMVVGEVPYQAETPMAVVVKHIVDPLPMPRSKNPDVPEALQRVILKALAKEPDDRYQSAGEIAEATKEVVQELPGWTAAEMKTVSETREPLEGLPVEKVGAEEVPISVPPQQAVGITAPGASTQVPQQVESTSAQAPKRSLRWPLILGVLGVMAICAVAGIFWGGTIWEQIEPMISGEVLPGDDLFPPPPGDGSPPLPPGDGSPPLPPGDGGPKPPGEVGDPMREGERLLGERQPQLAMDLFKGALEEDPGRWEEFMDIVYNSYEKGGALPTINLLEIGLPVAGKHDLGAYEWLGWLYLEEGRLKDAQNLFRSMIKEEPGWAGAYDGLVTSYSQNGEEKEAINYLKDISQSFPDEPNILLALGNLHIGLGDYQQAEADYDEAIQIAPDDPWGYMQIAGAYIGIGDFDKAEAAIDQALQLDPNDGGLLDSAAWWFFDMGDYTRAIEIFQQAIDRGYDHAWTYMGLAQSYMELGEDEAKIRDALEKAENMAEGDPWLLVETGWLYLDLDDCPMAVRLFEDALEIDPSLFEARDGLNSCKD